MKYAVDSLRKFLRKRRKPGVYEKRILHFFSQLSTALPQEYVQLFRNFQKELFQEIKPLQKAEMLDYLDFEEWSKEYIKNN